MADPVADNNKEMDDPEIKFQKLCACTNFLMNELVFNTIRFAYEERGRDNVRDDYSTFKFKDNEIEEFITDPKVKEDFNKEKLFYTMENIVPKMAGDQDHFQGYTLSTRYEKEPYLLLMKQLVEYEKKSKIAARLKEVIESLRDKEYELNPEFHHFYHDCFLHRVDSLLSTLIFGNNLQANILEADRKLTEKAREFKRQETKVVHEDDEIPEEEGIDEEKEEEEVKKQVLKLGAQTFFLGLILIGLIVIGVIGIWFVWTVNAGPAVDDAVEHLASETLKRLQDEGNSYIHDLFIIKDYIIGSADSNDFNFTNSFNNKQGYDGTLINLISMFPHIVGITIGTEDNNLLGIYRDLSDSSIYISEKTTIADCSSYSVISSERDSYLQICDNSDMITRSWWNIGETAWNNLRTVDSRIIVSLSVPFAFTDKVEPAVLYIEFDTQVYKDLLSYISRVSLDNHNEKQDGFVFFIQDIDDQVTATSIADWQYDIGSQSGSNEMLELISSSIFSDLKVDSYSKINMHQYPNHDILLIGPFFNTSIDPELDWRIVLMMPESIYRDKFTVSTSITWVLGFLTVGAAILLTVFSYRDSLPALHEKKSMEFSLAPEISRQVSMEASGRIDDELMLPQKEIIRRLTTTRRLKETKEKKNLTSILQSRKLTHLGLFLSLIFLIMSYLAIWFTWTYLSRGKMDDLNDLLVAEGTRRFDFNIIDYLKNPSFINQINYDKYIRNEYNVDDLTSFDSSFYNLMNAFKGFDNSISVREIQIIKNTGEFTGFLHNDDDEIVVVTGDSSYKETYSFLPFNFSRMNLLSTEISSDLRLSQKYINAAYSSWSDLEIIPNTNSIIHISHVVPYPNNTVIEGVFVVLIELSKIDEMGEKLLNIEGHKTLVMQQDGYLVSTSLNQQYIMRDGNYIRMFMNESSDEDIRKGGIFILQDDNDNKLREAKSLLREWEQPITGAGILSYNNMESEVYSLHWVIGVLIPRAEYLEEIEKDFTLSFILCGGSVLVIVYLATLSFRSLKENVQTREDRAFQKEIDMLSSKKIRLKDFDTYLEHNRMHILMATEIAWKRTLAPKSKDLIISDDMIESFENFCSKRAIQHITDAQSNRNILKMCDLESHSNLGQTTSQWPVFWYRITTSIWYRFTLHIVILVHILLSLFEPQTRQKLWDNGCPIQIILIEAICLIIEFFDFFLRYSLNYKWGSAAQKTLIGLEKRRTMLDILLAILYFFVFLDWILTISVQFSYEYWFPLRPFILVIINDPIRRTLRFFVKSLTRAIDVFLLYFSIIFVAAAFGSVLFGTEVNTHTSHSSFSNFVRSLTTVFVFISTGENYVEVVYPTNQELGYGYMSYYIILTVVGMFFVIAMVIGSFQIGFNQMRQEWETKRTVLDRAGMIAGFALLDFNRDGSLSSHEFTRFLQSFHTNSGAISYKVYTQLDKDHEGGIDLKEFVQGMEHYFFFGQKMNLIERAANESKEKGWRKTFTNIFMSNWLRKISLFGVICYLWLFSCYGTWEKTDFLDSMVLFITIVFCIEIGIRIISLGWIEYWYYGFCHEPEEDPVSPGKFIIPKHIMFAHRFDLIIMGSTLILFLFYVSIEGTIYFGEDPHNVRFIIGFPIFRLFTVVARMRELVFTIFDLIPQFASIMFLLMVVFWIYGVLGVNFFAGKFETMLLEEVPGSFNSLSSSLLTLFQLLIGEAWHNTMYYAVRCTSWTYSYYFISFVVIMTLLFTNLFIGVVLENFTQMEKDAQQRKEDLLEKRRKKKQDDTTKGITLLWRNKMKALPVVKRATTTAT